MKTYVLYHANCPDGFTSAWVAHKKLGDEAEYIPVSYGNPPPEMESRSEVYILDFSYPRDVLIDLDQAHNLVQVEDHHKTAQADLEGLDFCHFDMDHSGAYLAWQYFDGPPSSLGLVQYIEDRDLWKFELPHSRKISAWIGSWPFTFQDWDRLSFQLDINFPDCVNQGTAILRAKEQAVEAMCRHAKIINIFGYKVPAANATVYFSEVGERLCELHPEAPFAAYWRDRNDNQQQWGLRSKNGFDVSAVARAFGGGGHAAAAGFVWPWVNIPLPPVPGYLDEKETTSAR